MYSHFLLGTLRVSRGAKVKLKRIPYDLIARHAINEHGNITKEEAIANLASMSTVGAIKSRYFVDPTNFGLGTVVIVTRPTWDETLVKLENEV